MGVRAGRSHGGREVDGGYRPTPTGQPRGRSKEPQVCKTPPRLEKAAKWTLRQSLVGGSPPDPP